MPNQVVSTGPKQAGSKDDNRGKITGPDGRPRGSSPAPSSDSNASSNQINAVYDPQTGGYYADIDEYNRAQSASHAAGVPNPIEIKQNSNITSRNTYAGASTIDTQGNIQKVPGSGGGSKNPQYANPPQVNEVNRDPNVVKLRDRSDFREGTLGGQFEDIVGPGFFTVRGQKERLLNVPRTLMSATTGRVIRRDAQGNVVVERAQVRAISPILGVQSTSRDRGSLSKNALQYAANNPFEVALDYTIARKGIPFAGAAGEAIGKIPGLAKVASGVSKTARAIPGVAPLLEGEAKILARPFVGTIYQSIKLGGQVAVADAGIKFGLRNTASKDQKDLLKNDDFLNVVANARSAQSQKSNENIVGSLADNFPFASNYLGASNKAFEESLKGQLRDRGYSQEQIKTAVSAAKRERLAQDLSLTFNSLLVNKGSEELGRAQVARSFEKRAAQSVVFGAAEAEKAIAKATRLPIARAGAVEGALSIFSQNQARGRDTTLKDLGTNALFGSLSAVTINEGIQRTALTAPKLSKGIRLFANIADPFEKPGDLAQDASEVALNKAFGFKSPNPQVFTLGNNFAFNSAAFAGTQTKTQNQARNSAKSQARNLGVSARARINAFFGVTSNTSTNTNVPVNTTTNQRSFTDIFFQINTPADVPANVPVDVPVNVPVNIPGFVPVSTNVPFFRLPPPMPLNFGFGGGGEGSKYGRRKVYLNELKLGLNLFNSSFGQTTKKSAKKSKSKTDDEFARVLKKFSPKYQKILAGSRKRK